MISIVSQERVTFNGGESGKGTVNVTLFSKTTPEDLAITGADIGIDGDIAPGSFLLTPSARYVYDGETGEFLEIEW